MAALMRQDLVALLYLNPELAARSNVGTVEAAAAGGYADAGLPAQMPALPPGFDARVYLAAQPDVSGLNATIHAAMLATGTSATALERSGEFVATLRLPLQWVGANAFQLPPDSPASFSACNLQVGDEVRLLRGPSKAAQPIDARVTSITGLRTIQVAPLDRALPLVEAAEAGAPATPYLLHGIRIWDAERQARVAYVRSLPLGAGSNDADQVPLASFEEEVYRALYPDARGLNYPDAYLDHRARWRNAEYRVTQGGDLFNLAAPYSSNAGGGSGGAGGNGGGSVADLWAGYSNLVVTSNAASLRSGLTAAASNLVLTTSTLAVGGDRLVVSAGGDVLLAGASLAASSAGVAVASNLLIGGGVGIGMADAPDPGACGARLAVGGDVFVTGTVISLSDARAKANVCTIDHPLDRVSRLRGVTFESTAGGGSNGARQARRHTGLLAQDVAEALPEALYATGVAPPVGQEGDGAPLNSVAYGNLAGLLVEAINALRQRVQALEPPACTPTAA